MFGIKNSYESPEVLLEKIHRLSNQYKLLTGIFVINGGTVLGTTLSKVYNITGFSFDTNIKISAASFAASAVSALISRRLTNDQNTLKELSRSR